MLDDSLGGDSWLNRDKPSQKEKNMKEKIEFLKFTGSGAGNAVYINPSAIEVISLGLNEESRPCTVIGTSNNDVCVRDTVDDVLKSLGLDDFASP
jgi:hypothetical protein